MREIRTSGSTRGGAPSGPLLLYRLPLCVLGGPRLREDRLCVAGRWLLLLVVSCWLLVLSWKL